MSASLVGSEMCIRDRRQSAHTLRHHSSCNGEKHGLWPTSEGMTCATAPPSRCAHTGRCARAHMQTLAFRLLPMRWFEQPTPNLEMSPSPTALPY
eukprot:1204966-Alexandrium_andersonii.AAC.1